jgi:predicted NAD-dependent protein-ADP-ribosyltransferase YbiA (DUF1768 family)
MPAKRDDFDPDQIHPFQSYRRLEGEFAHLHDLSPSIAHFYESEKLRGTSEDVRQSVLSCPTARAARKLAKRHEAQWRQDWRLVRGAVLRAGLAMQMVQSVEARQAIRQAATRADAIAAAGGRPGGVPAAFLAANLRMVAEQSQARSSNRLGLLILKGYEPDDLDARLDAMFSKERPFSAAVYVGEEASIGAEAWCMRRAVPLKHIGEHDRRLRAEDHAAIGQRITTLIVCAPQTRKEVSAILSPARQARTRIVDLTRRDAAR